MRVDAAMVDEAAERLAGVVAPSPVQFNQRLSDRTGAQVWLKREDLQRVRSYKARGAYNLIAQLTAAEREAGVVAASAGNHAQGLAFACAALRVPGRVYLPRTTPRQKRDRIAALGGEMIEIVVLGDGYDEAAAAAAAHAQSVGATPVPAFDDPRTIAGQGTVVREILQQLTVRPDVLIVPVGGGGLLAGTIAYLGGQEPGIRLVGVEPAGAACMSAAIAAGGPVDLPEIDTFVDGAAVKRAGTFTHGIVSASAAELTVLPEGQVCTEILELYQSDGIIAEPAGALASGWLSGQRFSSDQTVVAVVSGGNNDVSRYAEIIERALISEGRKHYFLVEFPQEPGALRRFLDEVLGPDDDITLFEYAKRSNRETGPALVGIELSRPEDLPGLLQRLDASPLSAELVETNKPLFRFLV